MWKLHEFVQLELVKPRKLCAADIQLYAAFYAHVHSAQNISGVTRSVNLKNPGISVLLPTSPLSIAVEPTFITISVQTTSWIMRVTYRVFTVEYRITGFNCVLKSLRFRDLKVIANLNIAFVWHMSYYLNRSGYALVLVLGMNCLVRRSE